MMQIKACFSLNHIYYGVINSQYSDIFIVPDRTKFEREKHKKLVEELKERHSQGVKDLVICNGVITSKHLCSASQPSTCDGEPLISHPDDVLNKNDLNYICNSNHTLSNTHDSILSIVILNCQSLLTKRAVLSTFVHEHYPDILAET